MLVWKLRHADCCPRLMYCDFSIVRINYLFVKGYERKSITHLGVCVYVCMCEYVCVCICVCKSIAQFTNLDQKSITSKAGGFWLN